jgi:RNA polymerase sigma-70 factor (ECF subfamily)
MLSQEELILGCQKQNRKVQKELYDRYAPILLGICFRYAKDTSEAEDVLQEGFIKIFDKIKQYDNKGSFEGWMKRIIVNTAISNYRKNLKRYYSVEVDDPVSLSIPNALSEQEYTKDELLQVIKSLPDGYRMVFNLYAIEGYKHKEIADLLDIDETTSKSQYSRAKKQIQYKLMELSKIGEY